MNCPNCNSEMLRTETISQDWKGFLTVPSAQYECPDCLSEYIWTKGRKGLDVVYEGVKEVNFGEDNFNTGRYLV